MEKHIEYLNTLHLIGDNWCGPGISKAPTKKVCEFAQNFLRELKCDGTEKIILGPIPSGGIMIEVLGEKNKLFVYLKNNDSIELEVYTIDKDYEFLNCTKESLLENYNKFMA